MDSTSATRKWRPQSSRQSKTVGSEGAAAGPSLCRLASCLPEVASEQCSELIRQQPSATGLSVTTLICRFKDYGANFRLSGCRENRTFWVTSLTDWVTSLTELRNTDRELRLVELRGPGRCAPALGLPPGGDAAAASSRACAARTHLNRASISARRMRLLSAKALPQKASSCKQKRADAPGMTLQDQAQSRKR